MAMQFQRALFEDGTLLCDELSFGSEEAHRVGAIPTRRRKPFHRYIEPGERLILPEGRLNQILVIVSSVVFSFFSSDFARLTLGEASGIKLFGRMSADRLLLPSAIGYRESM